MHEVRLTLVAEAELEGHLADLRRHFSKTHLTVMASAASVCVRIEGSASQEAAVWLKERFPTYVFAEESIAAAVHAHYTTHRRFLALAESCTGGSLAASLVAIPNASQFLLGSIVAYNDSWKRHFLKVPSLLLKVPGAVSPDVAEVMVQTLLAESGADDAVAITGFAGEIGKPIYIAVGRCGERCDVGMIQTKKSRLLNIDAAVETALGALYRRVAYKATTFS
ncbi:MAG: Nicotinamide-nucleotide amidohydrolase PncC [Chlamydiota bacterium]|jgi:PncC family amidohydrolase